MLSRKGLLGEVMSFIRSADIFEKNGPAFGHMQVCCFRSALKKNLYNHICWSNKGYYVQTVLSSKSGPYKLQQTCFCNINNLRRVCAIS